MNIDGEPTVRDLVAIKCLDFFKEEIESNLKELNNEYVDGVFRKCYKFADKFLKVRNQI